MPFCINCGNEISGHEAMCPHCDTKLEATIKREKTMNKMFGVMFIPFIIIGIGFLFGVIGAIVLILIQLAGR